MTEPKEKEMKLVITDTFLESIAHLPVEEQQAMIDEITEMFNNGSLLEESEPVEFDELPEELQAELMSLLDEVNGEKTVDNKRVLN